MIKKLSQVLLALVMVSVFGVLSSYAQEHIDSWKFISNERVATSSLMVGQGLKSKNGKYVAVMQRDGNFCLYSVNPQAEFGVDFIHCSDTSGNPEAQLWMGNDGNMVIISTPNAKGRKVLYNTETNSGDKNTKIGKLLRMEDDGRLVMIGWDNRTVVWDFQSGRAY